MRILLVCLGNICRSPLAEGILRHKAAQRNLDWQIESAGTGDWHVGQAPDPRSVAVARRNGIDISQQRGRHFQQVDFERFDKIIVMDSHNLRDVLRLAETDAQRAKVERMLDYSHPGQDRSVPDPYYGGTDGFDDVFVLLDAACTSFLDRTLS